MARLGIEQSTFSSFDGTQIGYQKVGAGPVIAICNGLGGSVVAWYHIIERFKNRFTFLAYDYRGFFESQRPADGHIPVIEDHVGDLEALLAHEGVEECLVFGWSMGVQVALEFACRNPQRTLGLGLVNGTYGNLYQTAFNLPGASLVMPMFIAGLRTLHPVIEFVIGHGVETPLAMPLVRKSGLVARCLDETIFHALAKGFKTFDMEYYFQLMDKLAEHSAEACLPGINAPTLIIHGEHDLMTPHSVTATMLERMGNAQLFTIPGGTHYSIVEYPEIANLKLEEFLGAFVAS